MKYSNVYNPKWADEQHTTIECMVNFDNLSEEFVPFAAVADGDYPHTHEIFARCVNGDFGPIAEYEPPAALTDEQIAASVRRKRNSLLSESDWTQLPDVTQATKILWSNYRQNLRDITVQEGFPQNVTWPLPPN